MTAADLLRIAHAMETELQRVPGTRDIETIGGPDRVVRVVFDPQRLAGYGLALEDLRRALSSANASVDAGSSVDRDHEVLVQAGTFLMTPEEVADLVVGVRDGAPVFLRDVATVAEGPDQPERYVSFGAGPAATDKGIDARGRYPAVTIAVSKKPGENAVDVAAAVIERFEQMRGIHFPDGVRATVTRNYGATAEDKAQTLIKKLLFATALRRGARAVRAGPARGPRGRRGRHRDARRHAVRILGLGLHAQSRVAVRADLLHRNPGGRRHRRGREHSPPHAAWRRKLTEAIPAAVDEVGGPTILATFTVIAALLPMAFVTGLMGPYMRPIPINASTGMLISLAVAFMFTPWLYRRLFMHAAAQDAHADGSDGALQRFFARVMTPFLRGDEGRRNRWRLLSGPAGLIVLSLALVAFAAVILKMLPFDNKSEFQVLVDMPEGTPVEDTQRVLQALAESIESVPEVTDYQTYAGAAAPINFNGLVRQYYLRSAPAPGRHPGEPARQAPARPEVARDRLVRARAAAGDR